jgi:hypothetical protein
MSVARSRRRPLLVLAVAACLGAGLTTPLVMSANAALQAPERILIESITSTYSVPAGTPSEAVPFGVVVASQEFSINVHLVTGPRNKDAAFASPTDVTVSATDGSLVSPITSTVAAGTARFSLPVTFAASVNATQLAVSSSTLAGDPSRAFDVLKVARQPAAHKDVPFDDSIGRGGECSAPTETDTVCGQLLLPRGAISDSVLLSLGNCDGANTATRCRTQGSVIQILADLDEMVNDKVVPLYTKSSPATLVFKCDVSLCGLGAIQNTHLNFAAADGTALAEVQACPRKGTIGATQQLCVDYVQSRRDGSSDTILYLLFTKDARISTT